MNKFKLLYLKARSFLPRAIPVGVTEFHEWADRIILISGQFADVDSMKYALASILMHADRTMAYKSDHYFVSMIRKAAANQVAAQIFQDIKNKQDAAAQAAKAAEVTATQQDASNASPQA